MVLNSNIQTISPPTVTVKKRILESRNSNPSRVLTHLDQSVVNMPLPESIVSAMKTTIDEISNPYGIILTSPWDGYASLKDRIVNNYSSMGINVISPDDVIITDGIEGATASVSDLFCSENNVIIPDPCEVFLRDMQRISGRSIRFIKSTPENGFKPMPEFNSDSILFISNPNSITGECYSRSELEKIVRDANESGSIIVYNSSLSLYLNETSIPRSIYEIPDAKDCAIEIFSFAEGFGVPELKVAYTVIPRYIKREEVIISELYHLRQHSNSTPPSYIMQKAAEMILSAENKAETEKYIRKIKNVGDLLSKKLSEMGIPNVGSATSPFIWAQCPKGMSSWQFFDVLLEKAGIVVMPGSIFGTGGEGFFRITSFGLPEEAKESAEKIAEILNIPPKEETPIPEADILSD